MLKIRKRKRAQLLGEGENLPTQKRALVLSCEKMGIVFLRVC